MNIYILFTLKKTKNKEKEAWNVPFLNNTRFSVEPENILEVDI